MTAIGKGLQARRATVLGALLVAVSGAWGHGDENPLYVAANGTDRGRCQDPATPCRTLEYALGHVGKGGQVRVGAGRFALGDPESLFPLLAGIVELRGGFDAGFRQPDRSETILTGVPPEYRALFASRGFHVLADRKGGDAATERELKAKLDLHSQMQTRPLAATPCTGGLSGGLACSATALLAHVPFASVSAGPAAAADVWGFIDLNTHREYVLVGFNIGTGVFDVTDPEAPREV
ncbi:MAG TPA: hypothetical protein VFY03_12085, partial [Woeseiaceae bacterium]|nr:hypothetical protein [Woeseiaceae bacterium]